MSLSYDNSFPLNSPEYIAEYVEIAAHGIWRQAALHHTPLGMEDLSTAASNSAS